MFEIFIAIIVLLIIIIFFLFLNFQKTKKELSDLKFLKSSQSVKYGKITEQWMPFLESFPYDPGNFRFLGSPIDGVAFNEDKIIFLEFKFSGSQLNKKQKKVKELVKDKKVEWKEIRIN